jgi:hypothetical protein
MYPAANIMRVRNGANTINQIVAVGRNLTALLKQNRRELASPGIQEAKNSRSQEFKNSRSRLPPELRWRGVAGNAQELQAAPLQRKSHERFGL